VLGEDPEVFFDGQLEVGADWPEALAEALNYSCCMVAVWSPTYFRSKWCMAEWQTMSAREQEFGIKLDGLPGLVYPVVYSDGDYFPEEAKRTQQKRDLQDYAYPYAQFKNSEKYLIFHDKVAEIAKDLEKWLRRIPDYSSDWQSVRPEPTAPYLPKFRRL